MKVECEGHKWYCGTRILPKPHIQKVMTSLRTVGKVREEEALSERENSNINMKFKSTRELQ